MKIKQTALIMATTLAAGLVAVAQSGTNSPAPAVVVPSNSPAATTNAESTVSAGGVVATSTNAAPSTNTLQLAEDSDAIVLTPTNAVRMNFRDVPLNTVLNYLSARMGFVVVSEGVVRGNATIVSEQPVGTNEVMELLSSALARNNYSVSRSGRVLTITSAETAKNSSQTPVKNAASPADIPINDQIATYVLPVHTLNPTQLIKDLDQLIPTGATVAANEAGNAIIMTARQKDIHRFSEIINALDSSSVSEVEVFILKYADAKSVAAELKEVFQSPDSAVARSDSRTRFRGGFGGFGGMGFGGGGGDQGGSSQDSKNASNKAVFTSDDQMNAVIASAPPDYFQGITNVIDNLDKPSTEITVMKVFHLKYADPQETADMLSNLFPDETKTSDQSSRSLGMRFMPPWMQQPQQSNTKSPRMTIQTLVRAVPDLRTFSVVVTASKEQMEQIAGVVQELDENPAGKQKVFAYQLSTADPVAAQAALTALFSGPNTKAPSSSSSTASALQQRETTAAQQQQTSTTGFGTSGSGTAGSH